MKSSLLLTNENRFRLMTLFKFFPLTALVIPLVILAFFCSVGFHRNAVAGELVTNQSVGFSIELPDGWVQPGSDAFYENLGRVVLDDPEFQKTLVKRANIPLAMATKHAEPYSDVNPSVKVNVRPYGNLPSREPVEIISIMVGPLKKLFRDFKVVSGPENVLMNGNNVGHIAIEYTMVTDAGSFPIASELWVVPGRHLFYMIGTGYKQGENADAIQTSSAAMSFKLLKASGE
jgi:hypothetical protein